MTHYEPRLLETVRVAQLDNTASDRRVERPEDGIVVGHEGIDDPHDRLRKPGIEKISGRLGPILSDPEREAKPVGVVRLRTEALDDVDVDGLADELRK